MWIQELVIASRNDGKIKEFEAALQGVVGVIRGVPSAFVMPEETGATFFGNAVLKARTVCDALGVPALADDSGLVVEALDGEPGVRSARFGGVGLDDRGRTALLLERMEGIPMERRLAKFVAALAVAKPDGTMHVAVGECAGTILFEPRGEGGFGYDPIFYYPPLDRTFAELTSEEKNSVSHRAQALRNLLFQMRGFYTH